MNIKTCFKCNQSRPISDFHKKSRNKDGLMPICKDCNNLRQKEAQSRWRKEHPEQCRRIKREAYKKDPSKKKRIVAAWRKANPDKLAESQLLYKYGITLTEYNNIKEKQNGRCAICDAVNEKLVVDHSHETGKVRGLLCNSCNLMLGHSRDNSNTLNKGAKYLKPDQELS